MGVLDTASRSEWEDQLGLQLGVAAVHSPVYLT